ncbi:MAG: hypothetical protein AAB581_01525 [Patescibacteria group bacterium]
MNTSKIQGMIAAVIGIVVAVAAGWFFVYSQNQEQNREPGKYDAFAQCLEDKGAVFYGAFWCPHCQSQKKMFGSSEALLPYVECSTPNGKSQTQECKDKKIENYPTWEFADGSRMMGKIALEKLAEKTGCELPQ